MGEHQSEPKWPSDNAPSTGVAREQIKWFCQVVEAEMLVRQAGTSPRSYPAFRRPALSLLFLPNSRIAASSLGGTPARTADAVEDGSVGQWGHMPTRIAGHAPLI